MRGNASKLRLQAHQVILEANASNHLLSFVQSTTGSRAKSPKNPRKVQQTDEFRGVVGLFTPQRHTLSANLVFREGEVVRELAR